MNEDEIIANVAKHSAGFIGDDAAILPAILGCENYVISKDLLVENVHFRTKYFKASDLAYKALNVNLSDIAAMGAIPKYILCGICIPKEHEDYALDFLENLAIYCKQYDCILIGGDTTASTDKLNISITVIGIVNASFVKLRNSAQEGSLICVAGNLGYAHLGLQALENNIQISSQYKKALLRPKALLKEGLFLASKPFVHSMMDLSDGVLIDLKRLCKASKLGARIDIDKLTLEKDFIDACNIFSLNPCEVALIGGEDYGLLFTLDEKYFLDLQEEFKKIFGYNMQAIGIMQKGSIIEYYNHNKNFKFSLEPYNHLD